VIGDEGVIGVIGLALHVASQGRCDRGRIGEKVSTPRNIRREGDRSDKVSTPRVHVASPGKGDSRQRADRVSIPRSVRRER